MTHIAIQEQLDSKAVDLDGARDRRPVPRRSIAKLKKGQEGSQMLSRTFGNSRRNTGIDRTCHGTRAPRDYLGLGRVTAELVDNNATRALVQMLPLTIEMRDHLRLEKTGYLPSNLPAVERRLD